MRTVCVSDTHGKDIISIYDEIIHNYEKYNTKGELQRLDHIIFLGDFMDNRYVNPDLQIKRFLDLFKLKECDDRIHILVGNHDAKYMEYIPGQYRDVMSTKDQIEETVKIYNDYHNQFEYAFYDGKYLYSHTGLSKEFLKAIGIKQGFDSPIEICNHLNKMLFAKMYKELFYVIDGLKYRHCIIKENPNYNQLENLKKDNYDKAIQVVGHYASEGLQISNKFINLENENHGNYMLFES